MERGEDTSDIIPNYSATLKKLDKLEVKLKAKDAEIVKLNKDHKNELKTKTDFINMMKTDIVKPFIAELTDQND